MIDLFVLQTTPEFTQTAHDVVWGPLAFNWPWGSNLSDELFWIALYKAAKAFVEEYGWQEAFQIKFGQSDD